MENNQSTTNINWYPGHMEKAKRQMQDQLKLVDIIIELRDARMPIASANPMLKQLGNQKPRLIVLTKKDKADESLTEKWLEELNKETDAIAISSFNDDVSKIITAKVKEMLKAKLERAKARGIRKKVLRAMVVGIPNVGKSTFINAITKKKATKVENRPGVTRNLQWVRLHEDLELLDTPGVLWPKFDNAEIAYRLALLAAIVDRVIDKQEISLYGLKYLIEFYPEALMKRYDVQIVEDPIEMVKAIAISKKWLKAQGDIDLEKTYDMFLTDVRNDALGRITWERV